MNNCVEHPSLVDEKASYRLFHWLVFKNIYPTGSYKLDFCYIHK